MDSDHSDPSCVHGACAATTFKPKCEAGVLAICSGGSLGYSDCNLLGQACGTDRKGTPVCAGTGRGCTTQGRPRIIIPGRIWMLVFFAAMIRLRRKR